MFGEGRKGMHKLLRAPATNMLRVWWCKLPKSVLQPLHIGGIGDRTRCPLCSKTIDGIDHSKGRMPPFFNRGLAS